MYTLAIFEESSLHDEMAVVEAARNNASTHAIYTSVVGIGVDLSVGTVEQLSSIIGCR